MTISTSVYHEADGIGEKTSVPFRGEAGRGIRVLASGPPRLISSGSTRLVHDVYDRTLDFLENRQVQHVESGKTVEPMIDSTSTALLLSGMTMLQISKLRSSIIDDLERHPCWSILRDVPQRLYDEMRAEGKEDLIFDSRVVAVPNASLNRLLCDHLSRMFEQAEILSVPGFSFHRGLISLDVGSHLRSGYIVGIHKNGLLKGLKVYRGTNDARPFILRSRGLPLNA